MEMFIFLLLPSLISPRALKLCLRDCTQTHSPFTHVVNVCNRLSDTLSCSFDKKKTTSYLILIFLRRFKQINRQPYIVFQRDEALRPEKEGDKYKVMKLNLLFAQQCHFSLPVDKLSTFKLPSQASGAFLFTPK